MKRRRRMRAIAETLRSSDDPRSELHFWRGQVLPRRRELFLHWAPYCAIVASLLTVIVAPHLPASRTPISDIAATGLTYASIATGGCFSAIVLSVGLPGADRLKRWALKEGPTAGRSSLSDLVFVLVWAATWQLALIGTCVLALLFGGRLPIAPTQMVPSHTLGLFVGMTVFYYALFELMIVVNTLSQIGTVINFEERNHSD